MDPFGVFFDSATGRRIDGAQIRIIDVSTGQPEVFGDEPLHRIPGDDFRTTVRDEAGVVYTFGAGEYRFPLINPGTYRFEIVPPNRFSFPSARSGADIAALPDGPYVMTQAPGVRTSPCPSVRRCGSIFRWM